MKFISLDRRASELAISDDGYEQVLALIQASLVCGKCQLPYTEDNPCVGSNLCLSCLLVKQSQLTFMGRGMAPDGRAGEPTYWLVDEHGYVFLAVVGLSSTNWLCGPQGRDKAVAELLECLWPGESGVSSCH